MRVAVAILSALAMNVALIADSQANYTDQEITEGLAQCKQSDAVNRIEVGNCEFLRKLDIERRLNSAYQKLIASLRQRGDKSSVEHLRKAQRAWVNFREASCEIPVADGSPPFDSGCMANMAEDRILYFEGQVSGFLRGAVYRWLQDSRV